MRSRSFEYFAASSLHEALELLHTKDEPKILAGGQSLVALMKLRLASPKTLIDINGIRGLDYVREENGSLLIGALTRHHQLENNPLIRQKLYILAEAASVIADQQIRNRGTVGGALAHADPSGDLQTALTSSDASVVLISSKGPRLLKCSDFFLDFFTTALMPDEIVSEIRVPIPPQTSGGAYMKLSRRHGDFAIVGAAAVITIDENRACRAARVALGGVAPVPRRAEETENALTGRIIDDEVIREAAQKASEGLRPTTDIHASSEYRLEMSRVMAERAIKLAVSRAAGSV